MNGSGDQSDIGHQNYYAPENCSINIKERKTGWEIEISYWKFSEDDNFICRDNERHIFRQNKDGTFKRILLQLATDLLINYDN